MATNRTKTVPPVISIKIRLHHEFGYALGPGKAALLEAIIETKSVAAAGRKMGLSYWKTRHLLDEMNKCFASPVVVTTRGGDKGGGSRVTKSGMEALALFREMEEQATNAISPFTHRFQRLLAKQP